MSQHGLTLLVAGGLGFEVLSCTLRNILDFKDVDHPTQSINLALPSAAASQHALCNWSVSYHYFYTQYNVNNMAAILNLNLDIWTALALRQQKRTEPEN